MARWAFNPLTNELDRLGEGGGGGGSDITIRGEDGSSITGDDFDFLVQKSGDSETPIGQVDTSTGEVVFSYNAWETPYVVDSSVDAGEKGTFSTIQSAIDAAILDGASITSCKVISIRVGSYTEDLNIPPGIFLRGQNLIASTVAAVPEMVEIFGNHVMQGANILRAQGISFRNPVPSQNMFSIAPGASTVFFNFVNCWINNGSSPLPAITTDFQFNRFTGCTFNGPAYSPIIEILTGGVVNLNNCVFTGAQKILNAGQLESWDSSIGEVVCDSGRVYAYNSNFRSDGHCLSGSTGEVSLHDCRFASVESAVDVTNVAATAVVMTGCAFFEGQGNFYEPTTNLEINPSQSGNVCPHIDVDNDYELKGSEQVVFCDTTNGPIAITLQSNPVLDRVWTIKDSSGNASSNNITLSLSGKTIDGQASYVIDSNFGCVSIQATETGDYLVVSETRTSGGGATPQIKITKFFADGTWAVEPLAKTSRHLIWSGGGGGGSGRSGASGLASGGGGGAPGSFLDAIIDHSLLLDSTYSVTVGAGGEGGAPVSGTEVSGNPGTNGGGSSVGDPSITGLGVAGGNAGQAGGTATGGGGTGSRLILAGMSAGNMSGGNGTNTNGTVAASSPYIAATGGAGGVGYTSGTARQGPNGGSIAGSGILYLAQGGAGGDSSGGNAGDGNSYTGPLLSIGGSGGGAGGHDGVTTAGNGGNGASPGGGGGGGAGNLSGNPSGAGGNGGDGRVIIIEYF